MDRGRLAAIAFFAGLAEHELDVVARAATDLEFARGDRMTTQGEFGHALFVIDSGTAEVLADGLRLRAVGPGDVVGEIAVLASGRRTASVVATSPVRAFAWFKRDVWALEKDAPEAARRLRAALDERVGSQRAN
jgi:CRP-like cAMP-binding protein